MEASRVSAQRLQDLATDLAVEARQLGVLVEGLAALAEAWEQSGAGTERVDAAALRLQSFYTGIERCLVQIVRVLNGGTPDGADWHRRLLERLTMATDHRPALLSPATTRQLGELLRFRHLVRHLYAYDLDAEQVQRLLRLALDLWPQVLADLQAFERWLLELAALAEGA
jgi:hypothetical protein